MEHHQAYDTQKEECCGKANQYKKDDEKRAPFEIAMYARLVARELDAKSHCNREAQTPCGYQESVEVQVVPLADAVVDKGTMMIKRKYTVAAIVTMGGARWSNHLARGAPLVALGYPHFGQYRGIQAISYNVL